MRARLESRIDRHLIEHESAGLRRRCPTISGRAGAHYRIDGRPVVGFCSNDYLGLAADPLAARDLPAAGAGASRLVCGDLEELRALEAELAELAGSDDAVLFPSGFQLNVGVLPALIEPGDRVFSDRLNHASLIDGIRLARGGEITILTHGEAPPFPRDDGALDWWITEAIFSMDGDRLDVDAARAHVARGGSLYVDEAHSLGLFAGGQGLSQTNDLRPTLLIGTLGKALGAAGAFVATSRTIAAWLRARARSYVFSTGVSPALAAIIRDQVRALRSARGDERRAALWANVRRCAAALGADGPERYPSPIFPLIVGDNHLAVHLASALLDRGWHVQAIRPPTVPEGTARLRLTVSALHSSEEIDRLVDDLQRVFAHHGLPAPTSPR
ncbi:MAG: aminotransferase class I/II-fold pyridoxal phosphate-dependent enzyme [Myxococcales bacterium]|nr:aminotransferase class I/II-fold pyridoxal phosphate-dependent enzyme [Myxococcales bacterium]MCB9704491.1 aminotransferase class I/II-fold pyridoxal phosphate-dependent enzyme [Myxococcales bacterium]